MADKTPQTYANHTRFDPPFHFFAVPVLGITVPLTIWNLIRDFSFTSAWMVLVSLALLVVALRARIYALKAQDRIIRLEERLRLSTLLAEPVRARIPQLTESQLVALRFACDAEIPGLVEKALAGNLSSADIKQGVSTWRPDTFRI
jgi:hypothetical protein